MRQLLPYSTYATIFSPFSGASVYLHQGRGNVGDSLIEAATSQLFDAFNIKRVYLKQEADVLMYGGGGNMGLNQDEFMNRCSLEHDAYLSGKEFVILPQSWLAPEYHFYGKHYAREQRSIDKYKLNATLMHDLSLCYIHPLNVPNVPKDKAATFHRSDSEALDNGPVIAIDPAKICNTIQEYFFLARQYEHIVTNRLHFAIVGLMLERRVTLFANNYHKNIGVWETSLKDLGCEFDMRSLR